jgi:RNA polymerase sigma factor (sigma-70 family)
MTPLNQIVDGCKRGDSRAQWELYDLFKNKLMGICRRYAGSREEAQDILQDAFVRIFSKISQLEDPDKISAWLTRVTVNTAVNFYHRNKRISFLDIELTQVVSNDYEEIFSQVSDEFLVKTINELPDGCRIVFNLNVVEGYSHAEIATLLGISVSTSRSQLNYARTLLKNKLSDVGITKFEKYA